MLRIIHENGVLPLSFPVDPNAQFEPGQISQICVQGNQILMGVSNGRAPFGIIDDIRTKSFSNVSWDEIIEIVVEGTMNPAGKMVSTRDISHPLNYPNIIPNSFQSTVPGNLNDKNGIITFPAGTELNYDIQGTGVPSGIKAIVNYSYYVANVPGDDSVSGSGQISIWRGQIIFQTNMFETNQSYSVNAPLYVSEYGILTSRRPSEYHPAVGMVTAPPSQMQEFLEVAWF